MARQSFDNRLLIGSSRLWFVIALFGQWLFALYVAIYFGGRVVTSGLQGFSGTHLQGGYIDGDLTGNVVLAAHVMITIIVHGVGPLQFIPAIRQRAPGLHRFIGRIFVVAVIMAALSGLYVIWIRGTHEGFVPDLTNTLEAALIFVFSIKTVRNALARNIAAHRRWALRLFIVASAVWFVRLGVYGAILATQHLGIEFRPISQHVITSVHIAKLIVPLGVLELYLWAQRSNNAWQKVPTAALICLCAIVTGYGIYAVTTIGWLPKLAG